MVTWASYNGPLGFTILLRSEAISHELWKLDANTGETRHLTNPDVTPSRSPTATGPSRPTAGTWPLESQDHNIWLLTLMD